MHDGQQPSLDHSISPGVPCPETLLVARMTDGSYLLVAYPQREPAAFVAKAEAGLLRQALHGAFGSPLTTLLSEITPTPAMGQRDSHEP